MYTRMLIPLDGSKVAEQVLPYARFLAKALKIPVALLQVVDLEALRLLANPERGRYIDTLLSEKMEGRQVLPGGHRPIVSRKPGHMLCRKGNSRRYSH